MGTLTEETAGNGITTNLTYDPHVERLTVISAGSGGAAKSYAYDATGNLTSKSDVGTYAYPAAGSARPHGVSSIAGTVNNGTGTSGVIVNPTYSYDANGNMISGGGRTLTYTAFNAPATITSGSSTLSFTFDSRHKRIIQTAPEGTTLYLNGGGIKAEKFTAAGTYAVTWRDYVVAEGTVKAIHTEVSGTSGPNWGSATWGSFAWTSSIASTSVLYLHQDHLGSIAAISGGSGSLIEQDSYDPWGKRRNLNGTDDTYDAITSQTTRGYTGQEHLGDVALIHYNARVYDPQIGRFSGTDPLVGQPLSTQGWNRFAYVMNNPLRYTDPTGRTLVCATETYNETTSNETDAEITVTDTSSQETDCFGLPDSGSSGGGGGAAGGAPLHPVPRMLKIASRLSISKSRVQD